MEASNYNKQEIKDIVLTCKHTERDTKKAIESYIAENDRRFGGNSVGELSVYVVLYNHYDEYTGDIINDNWETTVIVEIEDDVVQVTFD